MGLSEEGEDTVLQRFEEICLDLNMDGAAKGDAWQNYQKIIANYTLEGDQLHWLACALYEACRRSLVPTVGRGTVEGNCVSLTRLLRSSKFSLIQFFNKMRKWSDMAALSIPFRDKIDKLERNFAVSTVIFKKFEPIFLDIFVNPATEAPRQPRGRKQRRHPCSANEVFKFAWTMFIQVKGSFPAISDDLVNSYHLLLCCIDWFFSNAIISGRKDLFNPDFTGLPEGFHQPGWKGEPEAPCIMQLLCEHHDGLVVEAKTIKEHWWKPHIKRLFEKKVLKGRTESLAGILDIGNFEENVKMVNNMYEEYVLSVGDFDERIFLGEDASEEIGTPGTQANASALSEQMAKRSLKQHFDDTRSLTPSTPLTGRRYLKEKDPSVTPVSTATQSVSRLQSLLSGTKTLPTDALKENLRCCSQDPTEEIIKRVKEMSETFCKHYIKPTENGPGAHIDFARKRLQLGESLYFKILEVVVQEELKRLEVRADKDHKVDLLGLMENDSFHRSLFACCLEIVIFSYNSQRTFPWIVDMFELNPYHFYKVIEITIRAEKGLSRDVVKHLNHIEESILESLAWKSDSPLWDSIKDCHIPGCGEVMPAHFFEGHNSKSCQTSNNSNTMKHPRLRSLVGDVKLATQKELLLSPTTPSVADRFNSPTPGNAKRRLFDGPSVSTLPFPNVVTTSSTPTITVISSSNQTTVLSAQSHQPGAKSILRNQLKGGISDGLLVSNKIASQLAPTTCSGSTDVVSDGSSTETTVSAADGKASSKAPQQAIVAMMEDGRQILIPVQIAQPSSTSTSSTSSSTTTLTSSIEEGASVPTSTESLITRSGQTTQVKIRYDLRQDNFQDDHNYMKPKKTGSLALLFRKVYHLASVRLRDLCEKLDIEDDDLIKKIWTCFERIIVHHIHLMCDRHLDQIIMCSMYLMAKVRDKSLTFQNIMKCYRLQPQAHSHVYRSVLLHDRKRHSSGSSDSSKSNAGSGPSSPVNVDVKTEKEKDKKLVRSSSTLPVPNPSSQPPTPTQGPNAQPAFDFEDERGDLIQFYNQVFVKKIRSFALKFADRNGDQTNTPKLSPMPAVRCLAASPRRVSNTHQVFISPHQSIATIPTPKGMCYSINRSPSKDLQAINKMIRRGCPKSTTKRVLEVDQNEDSLHSSPAKRLAPTNSWQRRLHDLQGSMDYHQ